MMRIVISKNAAALGAQAAADGAAHIRQTLSERGAVNIILATGASQFQVLDALVNEGDIDWPRVTGFHLDEYIGLPITHPASFRKYLKERFVDRVPVGAFYFVNADVSDVSAERRRVGDLLAAHPIDVAFIGIGENGHIAFNDPPADFEIDQPYIEVELDEACRRQQLGEGWFETLDDVPRRAVSMSVRWIMRSKAIICSVPDTRKAAAVCDAVEGPVTADVPASILQQHENVALYLDEASASRLTAR